MKKINMLFAASVIILLLIPYGSVLAWWDVGHQTITSKAIEYLPEGWSEFFGHYSYFLAETSLWPDTILRKNAEEIYYHYYDSEYPRETHLEKPDRGILPWRVAELKDELTNYIIEQNWYKVLETAGIMSHYLADVTNPYHTTVDYNPPITSNVTAPGVSPKHAFVEGIQADHINELIPEDLQITPVYIEDPLEFMFDVINKSYSFLDELNAIVLGDDITDPTDDKGWPELKPLLENRTITAIWLIASMWYTAIVDANAIDKAPNPEDFASLVLTVEGAEVPEALTGFTIKIIVRDVIGVPVDPDNIVVRLGDDELSIDNIDLGKYIVTVPLEILEKYSGESIELYINVKKEGYKSETFTKQMAIPGEEEVAPAIGTEYLLAGIIGLIVIFILALYLKRRS
jgi:hypothetical protein